MLVGAVCPQCRHAFSVDAGFIGTKRACPACGGKFLFAEPAPAAATPAAAAGTVPSGATAPSQVAAADLPAERLGCLVCLRTFAIKSARRAMAQQRCGFCEAVFSVEEGRQALELLDGGEKVVWTGLLAGLPRTEMRITLTQLGFSAETAARFLTARAELLPFVRLEHVLRTVTPPLPVGVAHECDLCSRPLPVPQENHLYLCRWEVQEAETGLNVGRTAAVFATGGIGVAITTETHSAQKAGLYFACSPCRSALTAFLFGKYQGFPTNLGYRLKKLTPCRGLKDPVIAKP